MMVVMPIGAANVVVMRRLRRAGVAFIADNLRAVLAELAVHRRIAMRDFLDPLDKGVQQQRMIAQIAGLDELDLGMARGGLVGRGVDAFHQNPGEEEIGEHDDAAKTHARGAVERGVDARMGDATECRLGPAETHPLPQHARDFCNVRIGVGVVGTAPDDDEQRVAAIAGAGRGDTLGRGIDELYIDRQVAAEPHVDARMGGHERVHLPGQVVLHMARGEQHPRHRMNAPGAARHQRRQPVADIGPGEFEIAGGEIVSRKARAQRRREQLEFLHRFLVAAAMAADQHSRFGHFLVSRLIARG